MRTKNCSNKVWRSWRPPHLLLQVPGTPEQMYIKTHTSIVTSRFCWCNSCKCRHTDLNNSLLPFSLIPSSSTPGSEPSSVSQMCVGPRRVVAADRRELVTCILCQEEQEVRGQGRAMVLAAFVQRSTVLSKNRQRNLPDPGRGSIMMSSEQNPISAAVDLDVFECVLEHHNPLFMHPDLSLGIHTASCGHIMHASCWQRCDTAETFMQNQFRDHKLIVCVFQVFWGCAVEGAKTSAASSRSHQLQRWEWRVSVSSLWMFEQHCGPSPATHRDTWPQVHNLSLAWGLTETQVIKPNDASLTVFYFYKVSVIPVWRRGLKWPVKRLQHFILSTGCRLMVGTCHLLFFIIG